MRLGLRALPRPLAFVLPGGGALGAYQVGILKALTSAVVASCSFPAVYPPVRRGDRWLIAEAYANTVAWLTTEPAIAQA